MNERDKTRFQHMLKAARQVRKYLNGKTKADLISDELLADGVLYQIAIIGEAANNISKETQIAHPEIVWPDIIGIRHIIMHGYFKVDFDIVWQVVRDDVPSLINQLRAILKSEEQSDG